MTYRQILDQLATEGELMPLTAEPSKHPDLVAKLKGETAYSLFQGSYSPEDAMCGALLRYGCWAEAHGQVEKLSTREASYWHAIVHRMEPDSWNSKYWFRQAGHHTIFPALHAVAERLCRAHPQGGFQVEADWHPGAFVDFCERTRPEPGSDAEQLAREIQMAEWSLLFEFCVRRGFQLIRCKVIEKFGWYAGIVLKELAVALVAAVIGLAGWLYVRGNRPPEVAFATASRTNLESVVTTNGKVEPIEWSPVRAETEGLVESVPVAKGQSVTKGQVLAVLESRAANGELASAEARAAQATAEIQTLESGGRSADLAEIDAAIQRAELDRDLAQRDVESFTRLVGKNAATKADLLEASDRLTRAQAQIRTMTARRSALVTRGDLVAAQARFRDAESAARRAKEKIALAAIRSPRSGVVYQLDVRPGAYLTPGSLAASVGRLDKLRVIVYVDEPELGRVRSGMPVTIVWDALPGREWKGTVDQTPAQIVALDTRQVGEVGCLIDNPDATLLPGTNVSVAIRSQAAANALTVPKESVVRRDGQTGVWLLEGDKVRWRTVTLGIASITRAEIALGLKAGDRVALPSASPLTDGQPVTPSGN